MARKKAAPKFIPMADLGFAASTLAGFLKRESEKEMLPYFFPDIKRVNFEMRKDGNYSQVEATIYLASGAARKFGIDISQGGVFWEMFKPAGSRKFRLVDNHFRGDE